MYMATRRCSDITGFIYIFLRMTIGPTVDLNKPPPPSRMRRDGRYWLFVDAIVSPVAKTNGFEGILDINFSQRY